MRLLIEVEQEEDGRWLGEVPDLPGVLACGQTRQQAIGNVQVLALRVVADRYPLRDTSIYYRGPMEPVAEDDWNAVD